MSITTRKGDAGMTRLFSGETVSKHSPRTEALGDLDELVSALGLARAHLSLEGLCQTVLALQRALFALGAEIATVGASAPAASFHRMDAADVTELDRLCADLEGRIRMPSDFILPGNTTPGAYLDHARALARRLERRLVALHEEGSFDNPCALAWINRLSDGLWLMARRVEGDSTPRRPPPSAS